MIEVCHGIAPFPQPSPAKNQGGDCFACATTAAMRHLFTENAPSFDTCWGWFVDERTGSVNNTWHGMRAALYRGVDAGYSLEIEADIVEPRFEPERWSYPWWSHFPDSRWARRLEGYLRGGWVAFTEIRFDGGGPMDAEQRLHSTDHFILLDGIRSGWESRDHGGSGLEHHVHVVCSARGAYWIRVQDFLRRHGGSGWWLARRDER